MCSDSLSRPDPDIYYIEHWPTDAVQYFTEMYCSHEGIWRNFLGALHKPDIVEGIP